jgi:acetolactate synthase I/III small subunit
MNASTWTERAALAGAVLEIDVRNHAGVMSHVVSLFTRRAYNLEAILVMPVGQGAMSRVWLKVLEDVRLPQLIKQVEKLEDVLAVRRHGVDHAVFEGVETYFRAAPV